MATRLIFAAIVRGIDGMIPLLNKERTRTGRKHSIAVE